MCTLFRRLGDIGACTIQTFTRVAWSIAFVVVHHIVFLVFVSSSVFCFSLLIFTMFVAVLKLIILFALFLFFQMMHIRGVSMKVTLNINGCEVRVARCTQLQNNDNDIDRLDRLAKRVIRIKRTKLIFDNYNSFMSFHPEAQESDTAIFRSDAKGQVEGKLETNVDNNRTKNPDSETLDVEETVRQIGEMTSSTGATTRAENDQQPIQLVQTRPSHNTARNRMYSSQNSFNSLDFDYYDIHDCSMYKNNTGSSTNDEQNGTAGDGAMVTNAGGSTKVIVKSSSSINIAGEVQSLFNPPISSSALNPQQCVPLSSQEQSHSLFRSTSSESISLKQRYQTTLQQKPYEKIRLGICAMDKKAQSQPMKEILSRLDPKGMVAFICVCLTLIASNI